MIDLAPEQYTDGWLQAPIEEGGLLLTQEWQFYAPWLALHHLDGYRPDLKIIDVNLVRRFWYLDYLERHVPEYMDALRSEVDTYKVPPTPPSQGSSTHPAEDAQVADRTGSACRRSCTSSTTTSRTRPRSSTAPLSRC